MRVFLRNDYEDLSHFAADYLISLLKTKEPGEYLNVALPCGYTVQRMYAILGEKVKAGELSLKQLRVFHIDEFLDLPEKSEHSQIQWMHTNLYSKVDILPSNVHYLNPHRPDSDYLTECSSFESLITSHGGLDLTFFGTGADGHVARNEPGSSLKSSSRITKLAYDTRVQLSERWGMPLPSVPERALTMGISMLFSSENVLVLFTGVSRSRALEMCLEKSVNHMFPVSAFQKHSNCTFAADEPATYECRVKTVNYFKGIEKTSEEVFGDPIHGRKRKAGT
ncbi:hypothetical protein TrVE_jg12228 [Triparma verrucosa]|uniref:glucosamine-6-phosphate deaminase n=2 Tax=Triparma TaxID=722752 RepID=A0A9W7DQS3_9STRA|nr:hypothetical protein TrST_g8708 [Triparma strigata]GMI00387.1 hypothetical protein TrVE_jg12228 [Triparma verrucosa]